MALGDKIAQQGNQLRLLLLNILDNNRIQTDRMRELLFQQAIQKILQDKERKRMEAKQKTARQQALVTQAGLALAPGAIGGLGSLLGGLGGGASNAVALGTAGSGAGDFLPIGSTFNSLPFNDPAALGTSIFA